MGQRSSHVKQRKHTPEQIVRKLREADRLLGEGQEPPEVIKYLEVENQKLKRIVADQALDIQGLKELSRGNF
jgi:putative transposase